MSHYEERIERDLGVIRDRLVAIGKTLDDALDHAVDAVLTLDRGLASQTILADLPINREVRDLDRACHEFVARHLPSAGRLRFISAVLRMNIALERIGDYAVTVAREAVQLSEKVPVSVARDVELLSDQARRMLAQSMKAFAAGNAELARGTKGMAEQSKSTFKKVFVDLLAEGEERQRPLKDLFALLVVLNRLERVSDQAKNICEETIFAATGEVKAPKVYRVLFVDERNDFLSVMAAAVARKAFPESGKYDSAGWTPAESLRPMLIDFLDRHGADVHNVRPASLPAPHDLDDYHVIVSLSPGARDAIGEIPFHTVLLEWPFDDSASVAEKDLTDEYLQSVYRELTPRVRELMETLRGEGAA